MEKNEIDEVETSVKEVVEIDEDKSEDDNPSTGQEVVTDRPENAGDNSPSLGIVEQQDGAAETHEQSTSPLPGSGVEDEETIILAEVKGSTAEALNENPTSEVDLSKRNPSPVSTNVSFKDVSLEQRSHSKASNSENVVNIQNSDAELVPENEAVFRPPSQEQSSLTLKSEDYNVRLSEMKLQSELSSSSADQEDGNWRVLTYKREEDGEEKESTIHILTEKFKKPFLGGFRHRLTNVEYHNASCQTYPKKRVASQTEKFHRDTQTVTAKNQVQQTFENTSTQMTKPGCYVSNVEDKVIIPGVYVTADETFARRLEKVIILQSHWRRWLAEQYVSRLRIDCQTRLEWERQEALRKQKERDDRMRKEFERRMNPRSKEDFDLLYAALERWRREEIEKIDIAHSGPERKAALVGLLEQESYLIASIERHKIKANKENKESSIKQFLHKAASPKKWKSYDGSTMEVETPYTLRAQELKDLYNSLQMKYLTQEERLDVLLTLKHTVKEHECKLTQEISELIDRETELLMRGVKEGNLDGLRQRISTLFIQYCKIPLFNPEAGRLLKVPQDPSSVRKNVYFCPSCTSYLPSSDFPLASNSRIVGRCRRCAKLDNDARLRQDFSKFRDMLFILRREEEHCNDGSKIAFIIQEADLRYLVENIWNGQSSLSAWEDLHDLVIVRWNKHEQWSPWNCVLLTKDEADAHAKLENVNEAYGRVFMGRVHHRHVLAQKHFAKLTAIADKMRTRADGKISRQSTGIVT